MPDLQIVLRGLTKYETYLVRVAFATSITSWELDVQTPCRDVNEADRVGARLVPAVRRQHGDGTRATGKPGLNANCACA